MKTLLLIAMFAMAMAGQDLASVKAEPNPEKRSEKALLYADGVVTRMRDAMEQGGPEALRAQLGELREAVNVSVDSLLNSGKNARKSPKHFKRAEAKLRELLRRLQTLRHDLGVDDRDLLDGVTAQVSRRIDALVEATLGGGK